MVTWDAARSICVGRALRRELKERMPRAWTCCADGIHEQGDRRQGRGLGRRLHVPREGEVLKEIGAKMVEWYDIKIRGMMGPDAGDDKEIRILNRVVTWESDKLIYEADDKHVTNILFELGFDEKTKGLDMPTAKDYDALEGSEDDEELDAHEARTYRRMAATINYFASDRPDLQFTASMLGRTMATRSSARYLKEHRDSFWPQYGDCHIRIMVEMEKDENKHHARKRNEAKGTDEGEVSFKCHDERKATKGGTPGRQVSRFIS